MKKPGQYQQKKSIKPGEHVQLKRGIRRWLIKCIFIFPVWWFACDDFFEKDISDHRIGHLFPSSGWASQNAEVNFSWSQLDGATDYHFQLVSPAFDSVHALILDSTVAVNHFNLTLDHGNYEWKVRAQNSVSASIPAVGSFEILSPSIFPTPISPVNQDTVKTNVVQFSWSYPDEGQIYSFELFSDADFLNPIGTKESGDTTVFIELKTNGQYFWRVKATSPFGHSSGYSSGSTFHLDFDETLDISNETVVLRSPVSSAYIATKQVSFWWDEVKGATAYTLQVVSPDFSETTKLIIDEERQGNSMDYELEEGDYQWRVKASNANHSTRFTTGSFKIYRSDISQERVNLSFPPDEAILKDTEISFKWEEMEGTEYQFILKKDDWDSGSILYQKTINQNGLAYTLPDGLYYWGVKAKALINASETEFSVRSFTLDNTPPGIPVPVHPVNHSDHQTGEIQFQWSPGADPETDVVYTFKLYKDKGTQNDLVYYFESGSTELSYVFDFTGTYYWQVMATDRAENPSGDSYLSSFTISNENDISNEPVSLHAPYHGMETTEREITFWWEEIRNAENYVFQLVKPNFATIEELVRETTLSSNQLTFTLEPGNYQWRVKAKNSTSETSYSNAYSLSIQQ